MKQIRLIVSSSFLFALLVALPMTTDAARGGKSRCTDRCADVYHVKKDACRLIPLKTERKICERRAKDAKNDCKHRCR
jgi:hypothetical protein